ncbi:hypothetical protein BHM03_00033589 [Ensete ventricosum]|nr:hypothetical protein BHM03_00033589 [Ensete ventricosum]
MRTMVLSINQPYRPRSGVLDLITRYGRSIIVDFDSHRLLSSGINLAATRLATAREEEARKKKEKEGEPRTASPSNGEVATRLLHRVLRSRLDTFVAEEPRDDPTDEENLARW